MRGGPAQRLHKPALAAGVCHDARLCLWLALEPHAGQLSNAHISKHTLQSVSMTLFVQKHPKLYNEMKEIAAPSPCRFVQPMACLTCAGADFRAVWSAPLCLKPCCDASGADRGWLPVLSTPRWQCV